MAPERKYVWNIYFTNLFKRNVGLCQLKFQISNMKSEMKNWWLACVFKLITCHRSTHSGFQVLLFHFHYQFFLRSVYWLILTGIRKRPNLGFQLLNYHPNPYHSAPRQLRYPWQDSKMSGGSPRLQGLRPRGLQ